MSHYFWAANGKLTKKKIIEHLNNSHFNVKEDQICIDDTCLSKNEISQLKKLLPGYNILENSKNLDNLTDYEVKLLLKEIFKKLYLSTNDDMKRNLFNEYFIYGLYDPKSGEKLSFENFYLEKINNVSTFDFQDIYLNIDTFNIAKGVLPESYILDAVTNNIIKANDRLILSLALSDIQNLGSTYYSINFKNYTFQLLKLNILGLSSWKIFLFTESMLNSMYIKQDEKFNEKFKSSLEIINIYNQRNELKLTEFRNYIDNVRAISILDGKFNLDVFKNNIFVNFYKEAIDLSLLTDDDVMNKIYNPIQFDKSQFTLLQDEKNYLGYFELSETYFLLERSDNLELRLIYGKKNSTDIYKWMLVYIYYK